MSVSEFIVLISLAGWPLLPIGWIPMHALPWLRKKMGLFYYLIHLVLWPPLAFAVYVKRSCLVKYHIALPNSVHFIGWVLLLTGLFLFIYAGMVLRLWGILGVPEVDKKIKSNLVTHGPYSLSRHPVYFAHSLIFTGIFFCTGIIPTLAIVFLDFFVTYFIIIPLEERELKERFGKEFTAYKGRVPCFCPIMSIFNTVIGRIRNLK